MSQPQPAPAKALPSLSFDPSTLPTGQLESLRLRTTQIIDSIQALQRTLEAGGATVMPPWPDILAKYNILLSQTHNLSSSLVGHLNLNPDSDEAQQPQQRDRENPYEKLALHPSKPLADAQLDNELAPLLRNQQTTDVLRLENATVRRLAEHMATKGSLGVLVHQSADYSAVLAECDSIRADHDNRVTRAVRAVSMLRDKYDWRARVAVDQEQPDEIDFDWVQPAGEGEGNADPMAAATEEDTPAGPSSEDEEEMEMEDVLGEVTGTPDGSVGTGAGTPMEVAPAEP